MVGVATPARPLRQSGGAFNNAVVKANDSELGVGGYGLRVEAGMVA